MTHTAQDTINDFTAHRAELRAKIEQTAWHEFVVVTGNNVTVDPNRVPKGDELGNACAITSAPTFTREEAAAYAARCHVADGSGVTAQRYGEVLERAITNATRAIAIMRQLEDGTDRPTRTTSPGTAYRRSH